MSDLEKLKYGERRNRVLAAVGLIYTCIESQVCVLALSEFVFVRKCKCLRLAKF